MIRFEIVVIFLALLQSLVTINSLNPLSDGTMDDSKEIKGIELLLQRIYENSSKTEVDPSILKKRDKEKQMLSLANLIKKIAVEYLSDCPPIIYYDKLAAETNKDLLRHLFKTFPIGYFNIEVDLNETYSVSPPKFINEAAFSLKDVNCRSHLLFLTDPELTIDIIGPQINERVVVVSTSSQWKLKEFLSAKIASKLINLLVIGESLSASRTKVIFNKDIIEILTHCTQFLQEYPYILYTHKLYTDSLGSNSPLLLTSWINGSLARPEINLFPEKFSDGFYGHRFKVIAANQPPFIFRNPVQMHGGAQLAWEGIEYRLLEIIGDKLNFTIDVKDTIYKGNTTR